MRRFADVERVEVSSPPPPIEGERFGRYVLLEPIGRGGMAEVFRAVSYGVEGFQRVFVIKRILKEKSASKEFIEMFVNEARICALLNHPNIVQIYDFGQIHGSYFLTMEHLRGKDLLSVLRQLHSVNRLVSPGVAAYVAQQVASGLHYAHSLTQQGGKSLNIVHRDVSPSNIMLLRAGGVKLLDFGIAKATSDVRKANTTQAGLLKGKLSYLSPEQVKGAANIDGRADVFALGVVLWESLTGKRLFFDKTDFQTMKNVMERPVPPPSTQRADLPAALDYIVVRALERDLDRRYPNAKMMVDDLDSFLQDIRYSPAAMPRLLDELFGTDVGQTETDIPETTVIPGEISQSFSEPAPPAAASLRPPSRGSLTPAANPSTSVPPVPVSDAYSPIARLRSMPPATRQKALFGGGAMAAVAIAFVLGLSLTRASTSGSGLAAAPSDDPTTTSGNALVTRPAARPPARAATTTLAAQPEPARAAQPGAAPAAQAPVALPPAPTLTAAAPPIPAAAAIPAAEPIVQALPSVTVKIDTQPPGADVKQADGTSLGITPVILTMARSTQPMALTISKPGFVSAHQTVTPDRDTSALFTLRGGRPAAHAKATVASARGRRSGVPAAAEAASDGKIRDGLSIDPFAEEAPTKPGKAE